MLVIFVDIASRDYNLEIVKEESNTEQSDIKILDRKVFQLNHKVKFMNCQAKTNELALNSYNVYTELLKLLHFR